MSAADRNTRRSDEIRRRRLAQSQPEALDKAASSRPAAGRARQTSWLDRLGRTVRPGARPSRTGRANHAAEVSYNAVTRRVVRDVQSPPPVMARRTSYTAAASAPTRRTKTGRRVYNVSLGAQGVEARVPSLPRLQVGWRVASFSLLAFLAAVLYWLMTSPDYQVQAAQINGLQRLTDGEVNRSLALTGKPIFMVDAEGVEDQLKKDFPEFTAVQVAVDFPNTVAVTVTERTPVLVWRQDGKDHLVDQQGMTFPARHEIAVDSYPVVQAAGDPPTARSLEPEEKTLTGGEKLDLKTMLPEGLGLTLPEDNQAVPLLNEEMVTAILQMAENLPTGAQLLYDPAHGFGWQDRRGWMVYMGSFEQMDLKLHIYRAIIEQLKSAGSKPALVSVEYPYAPYYRLEQ
jgi:hypothetical protein